MGARSKQEIRLHGAVRHLQNAVAALCNPQVQYLNNTVLSAPSLYQQLQEALSGEMGAGHNGAHQSQPPMWVRAADLLREIDAKTEGWQPECEGAPPTVARLRTLTENGVTGSGWRPDDVKFVDEVRRHVEHWVDSITRLLDPEHVKNFRTPEGDGYAPCPQCGKATTYRVDPTDGENKRVPCLQWTADAGTQCVACGTAWGPELTLFVARQLGFDLPDGVLE